MHTLLVLFLLKKDYPAELVWYRPTQPRIQEETRVLSGVIVPGCRQVVCIYLVPNFKNACSTKFTFPDVLDVVLTEVQVCVGCSVFSGRWEPKGTRIYLPDYLCSRCVQSLFPVS
jgi:hypothetical protein